MKAGINRLSNHSDHIRILPILLCLHDSSMIKRLDSVYKIYKHHGQKKALYLSVNVFSTKVHVLIGDAVQGAKKIIFTACHSGKLRLAFTSPDVISTSPKSFLTSRIDFTVLLLFEFLKKRHLPIGQVKNRIHQPDSKIH